MCNCSASSCGWLIFLWAHQSTVETPAVAVAETLAAVQLCWHNCCWCETGRKTETQWEKNVYVGEKKVEEIKRKHTVDSHIKRPHTKYSIHLANPPKICRQCAFYFSLLFSRNFFIVNNSLALNNFIHKNVYFGIFFFTKI